MTISAQKFHGTYFQALLMAVVLCWSPFNLMAYFAPFLFLLCVMLKSGSQIVVPNVVLITLSWLLEVVLRPHPADRKADKWRALRESQRVSYSDPRHERALDFVGRVDVVIAGHSNILLEAAPMNVYPLQVAFDGRANDVYGFAEYNLVDGIVTSETELCQALASVIGVKPAVRERARRHCATIGSRHDGHVAELATHLIEQLTSQREPPATGWIPVDAPPGVEAYAPR